MLGCAAQHALGFAGRDTFAFHEGALGQHDGWPFVRAPSTARESVLTAAS